MEQDYTVQKLNEVLAVLRGISEKIDRGLHVPVFGTRELLWIIIILLFSISLKLYSHS
jgi:hypothetical protein